VDQPRDDVDGSEPTSNRNSPSWAAQPRGGAFPTRSTSVHLGPPRSSLGSRALCLVANDGVPIVETVTRPRLQQTGLALLFAAQLARTAEKPERWTKSASSETVHLEPAPRTRRVWAVTPAPTCQHQLCAGPPFTFLWKKKGIEEIDTSLRQRWRGGPKREKVVKKLKIRRNKNHTVVFFCFSFFTLLYMAQTFPQPVHLSTRVSKQVVSLQPRSIFIGWCMVDQTRDAVDRLDRVRGRNSPSRAVQPRGGANPVPSTSGHLGGHMLTPIFALSERSDQGQTGPFKNSSRKKGTLRRDPFALPERSDQGQVWPFKNSSRN